MMLPHLTFTVPGPPHGKGRPRAARMGNMGVRMYTDAKTVAYEDRVALYASQAANGPPLEGPVSVYIAAFRARPKRPGPRHECRAGPGGEHPLCTAKPDADNIAKSVLDGCSLAGIWRDDQQVVMLSILKLWCAAGELPRTEIRIGSAGAGEPPE